LAARGSRREAEVSQAPAQAAEQAAPRRRMVAKAAPSETPHGNKVLLIEDDRAIQRVTRRILAAAGYTTEAVGTLSEARQALQVGADEPWAVLCDLSLPDGSGIDLLTWLQSARPGLCRRVFVLTGGATDQASRSFVQSGAFPVLHKPLESRLLLQTLAELKSRE